jgi:hypothetical protein
MSAAQNTNDDATERMFLFMTVLLVLDFGFNRPAHYDITGGRALQKK